MAKNVALPAIPALGKARRRTVAVQGDELVHLGALSSQGSLPLVISSALPSVDLFDWAANHRSLIDEKLDLHGGILFRGFSLSQPGDLERFIDAVSDGALEYKERSSPRSEVQGRIYTSTDYPPSYPIFLHNENSYQKVWPRRIFFFADQVSDSGGETPIADVRKVYRRIDPEIRQRFLDRGWMVVRNFGDGLGLDWPEVFQTTDRDEVSTHCERSGIEAHWFDGNRLRTRTVRRAAYRHPTAGEPVWFNHATFFHVSSLEPAIRDSLLERYSEEELPANTYYGDGSPIEPDVLDHLRQAYRAETVKFAWQPGDLLMLDNMLVAHGREPFEGRRRILVGMSDLTTLEESVPVLGT